jgi:hypothetical protein
MAASVTDITYRIRVPACFGIVVHATVEGGVAACLAALVLATASTVRILFAFERLVIARISWWRRWWWGDLAYPRLVGLRFHALAGATVAVLLAEVAVTLAIVAVCVVEAIATSIRIAAEGIVEGEHLP